MAKKPSAAKDNPKTTVLGIIALLASLSSIWAPPKYAPQIQATAGIIAGAGLIGAKDSDK